VRVTLKWGSRPPDAEAAFERSIDVLLPLALRQSAADAVFLYDYAPEEYAFHLRHSFGAASQRLRKADIELSLDASASVLNSRSILNVEDDVALPGLFASFPEVLVNGFQSFAVSTLVHRDETVGLLTFGWRHASVTQTSFQAEILSLGQAIGALLAAPQTAEYNQQLAERVARLQTDLADRKIAERIHGLLQHPVPADLGTLVREHVDRVLGACDLPAQLADRAADPEEQIAARETLVQAKALLQATQGISEEAAYLQLRNLSRRNRLPLREVASSVLHAHAR
jgi:hypothetical protein